MNVPLLVTPGRALIGPQGQALGDVVQFTTAEYEEYLRLTRTEYFMLKLKGVDIASACRRCGAGRYPTPSHDYFTLMCVERPWKGNWQDALFAYASVTKDPLQSTKLLAGLGELSQGHPETARSLVPKQGMEAIAFAISAIEVISRNKALALAERINTIGSMGSRWEPFVIN